MKTTDQNIRILLVDDHHLVRHGFKVFLTKFPQFEIVAEASNGREAIDLLKRIKVDIVLLDMEMPVMSGYEAIKIIKIRFQNLKVIVLSLHDDISFIDECITLGAAACINKGIEPQKLIDCIMGVHAEGIYLDKETHIALLHFQNSKRQARLGNLNKGLTPREKSITKALCNCDTEKEIADQMNISTNTVHFHKSNIFRKTNSRRIANLIVYAIRHRLFSYLNKETPFKNDLN